MRFAVENTKLAALSGLEPGSFAVFSPRNGMPSEFGLVVVVSGGEVLQGNHFIPLSGPEAFFVYPIRSEGYAQQSEAVPYVYAGKLEFDLDEPLSVVRPTYAPGVLLLQGEGTYLQCRVRHSSYGWSSYALDLSDWTLKSIEFEGTFIHPWKLGVRDGSETIQISVSPALIED